MSEQGQSFDSRLQYWLGGGAWDPVDLLTEYLGTYTGGRFELLAGRDHPDRITSADVVAVSMLSVYVPPRAAAWMLESSGSLEITNLLERIRPEPIWAQDESVLTDPDGPLTRLWALLQTRSSQSPPADGENKVGAVIAGKLLAAKRPHLVPVFDDHVSRALGAPVGGWWRAWRQALCDQSTRKMVDDIRVRAAASVPMASNLSDLRICDIVVWMAVHGRGAPAEA